MTDTLTPLAVSELRYRRLFEGARDGILILDLTTLKIVDANPYIQELLDYKHDELLGKELWEIGLIKDQAESQHLYQDLREKGFVRYDDLPLLSKSGTPREVEFVSNVYQEGDQPVIQCNIRDISQRKENEVQRERMVQTEKLKVLGEMARGVAHDLNQSLGLISGYSDLALAAMSASDFPQAEALRNMLELIAQAATDGGQIVSRLLTFARGQPDGPAEDVPLAVLLTRVGQLTAPRWRDTSHTKQHPIILTVDAEPDTVIRGWPASLREALVNLIFNAADAMPEGGTIRLGAHRRGGKIAVEVQDSGVGMSAEVQAQVFHPLFTTKGVNGTGLGLAQVASTVEQHGGEITIHSAPGQGTTFCIMLPAIDASTRRPSPELGGTLTILVVDDEPALAEILASMLRLDDHTVEVVHAGAVALERLNTASFDLVISDMGMPSMDGWELARQVRARHPNVLIVIASGWGSQISPEEAQEAGIRAVVSKPYRRADLQKAIASLSIV